MIESSPEFCNAALVAKSNILAYSDQYDEAVIVAGQIPDTAAVFNSFRSKSIHINQLLLAKAERLDCEDSVKLYKGNIATELENWISERKDSLYHALTQPIETPAIRNQHIVAFYLYLDHLSHDEVKASIKNLVNDMHLNKVRNENTDAHFDMFYEAFLPEYTVKANGPEDLCSEREPIGVARAACFEELAGVLTPLKKWFWTRKTGASDKKSGILLMDGAEIVVLDKENGSVRQEIRQFTDGRCQKCSTKQQKQGCPTGNQTIRCGTVTELQCKTTETGVSDKESSNSLMDGVEKLPGSRILTGLQS